MLCMRSENNLKIMKTFLIIKINNEYYIFHCSITSKNFVVEPELKRLTCLVEGESNLKL
jgi:hypothetical protein